MPLYLYACSECGHYFEELTSAAAGAKRLNEPCPKCCAKVKRSFSAPAIHMRGYSEGDARYNRGMVKTKEKKNGNAPTRKVPTD